MSSHVAAYCAHRCGPEFDCPLTWESPHFFIAPGGLHDVSTPIDSSPCARSSHAFARPPALSRGPPMPAATRAPIDNSGRLQFADDLFARRHRGLGSPIANQWIWRLDSPYDADRLRYIAAGLAEGGLSRQLHRARFPGARDLWTNADREPSIELYEEILPVSGITDWLQERHSDHLDPHEGLTYRLTAINLDDGTSVVSMLLAHAVGDGGSVLDAVCRASRGEPLRLPPAPATGLGTASAPEAADSRSQWRAGPRLGQGPPPGEEGRHRRARHQGTARLPGDHAQPRAGDVADAGG
ncbi:LigA [Nocardioidaceae bacterium Broad-1]|nr:LigA [Nocardioidaceae bacterium Broad-1]